MKTRGIDKKYQEINRYAEAIVDTTMDPPEMRMMLQTDEANTREESKRNDPS